MRMVSAVNVETYVFILSPNVSTATMCSITYQKAEVDTIDPKLDISFDTVYLIQFK